MIRERDKTIEYMARRICARVNGWPLDHVYVNVSWPDFKKHADEALKALNDFDAMRAA